MSTSPELSPANGHLSPSTDHVPAIYVNGDQSDSDLSDVQAVDVEGLTPESVGHPGSAQDAKTQDESEEPSEPSDNDGSDDADFDVVESLPSDHSDQDHAHRTSSNESQPPRKRKAGDVLNDEYTRNDPELYGLRRSVRGLV